MFSHDVHNKGLSPAFKAVKPPIAFSALDQPLVNDLWGRGNALYHALKVFLLTPETRAYIQMNDPKGLEQAIDAIKQADRNDGRDCLDIIVDCAKQSQEGYRLC